jgi:hypothetical protein
VIFPTDTEVPRPILEAVAEARRALADLRLEEKFLALELIEYWIQLELASWERSQDPTTH